MKLSLVFELLLIFVLLAFAASKSVKKQKNKNNGIQNRDDTEKPEDNTINKYCKCTDAYCNCCRDFQLPVVNLNGPGCASLMYLSGDKMSVSLSFGKKVITNRTLSSRKPSPVCMPLPGRVSKFCGRVYNIARSGEEFRACLGLELQSKSVVEAAVRVSCFKFGPRGVTSEPADPLPLVPEGERDEDDDDDDDDDDFGLGGDDDDDEEDDDDDDDDATNDVDTADYTGFSLIPDDILGGLFGSSSGKKSNKNKKKQAPLSTTTTTTTTTRRPRPSRRPSRKPVTRTTPRPVTRSTTVKVRPASRRPTRRPSRRPTRKPSTTATVTEASTTLPVITTSPEAKIPVVSLSSGSVSTERDEFMSTAHEQTFEPVIIVTQKPQSSMPATTSKSVTNFDDPGLEMSLAHITGQLAAMPVTPIVPNAAKDSGKTASRVEMSYEKVETYTPKNPSTVSLVTSVEEVNDDMVQVVDNLDSKSEELFDIIKEPTPEESRSHYYSVSSPESDNKEKRKQKRKNRDNEEFQLEDLDVLHLDDIGESLGHQLGIFGGNKKYKKDKKENKIRDGKKDTDDYGDFFGLDAFDSILPTKDNNKNKKNRRRQNKMMKGEWSQA
ncbi:DNA topoisomerase 1-like [Achroia grisella]|uniref:DNA topoisomerase 1-like n=1 Tax=Achroia grisella TaxID=688607 RepID=UPI0027D2D274|nr:DNA topoisomerase 1-like [Achroia grisella]XP_059048087.1 DNA topoisomerase 1-like [Achroia grisella]